MSPATLTLTALAGIPEVQARDDIADIVIEALPRNGFSLGDGDALVIAQKIVSKAEGRLIDLATVQPSAEAKRLAEICQKEPALIELVLRESTEVLRCIPGVIVVRHKRGFVMANAGIDQSNVMGTNAHALLLPEDPDRSAAGIRDIIKRKLGVTIAVLINDSFGRAWRLGTAGTCIGCAGLMPLLDLRGQSDRFGRTLRVTELALADEISSAASLLMGQADEGRPVIVLRGLDRSFFAKEGPASLLIRALSGDLFR